MTLAKTPGKGSGVILGKDKTKWVFLDYAQDPCVVSKKTLHNELLAEYPFCSGKPKYNLVILAILKKNCSKINIAGIKTFQIKNRTIEKIFEEGENLPAIQPPSFYYYQFSIIYEI